MMMMMVSDCGDNDEEDDITEVQASRNRDCLSLFP